jgi:tRNA dimethylallyltransferase
MSNRPILIAVVGPTASGKSHLGIALARRFDGEVINCDSLQMYRGFDIGTGKLPEAERQSIPHHLLDVLDPTVRFAAGDYARLAQQVIADIASQGRLPIIAGGTGFYLRALLDGLFPGPQRNVALRERLQLRADEKSREYLHRVLARLDPPTAARIHANDVPKVIRAIEVCLEARHPMSEMFRQGRRGLEGYRVIKIGLSPPRDELYSAINDRTRQMFEQGLVDEVRAMLEGGVPRSAPPLESVGYREAVHHIEGLITMGKAIELAQIRTRQYAKRQMTWFRKETEIRWLSGFGTDMRIQQLAADLVASETTRPCPG